MSAPAVARAHQMTPRAIEVRFFRADRCAHGAVLPLSTYILPHLGKTKLCMACVFEFYVRLDICPSGLHRDVTVNSLAQEWARSFPKFCATEAWLDHIEFECGERCAHAPGEDYDDDWGPGEDYDDDWGPGPSNLSLLCDDGLRLWLEWLIAAKAEAAA